MISSALRSAWLTKSPGPFSETCRFCTSPKSRASERPAFMAACTMTLMIAERAIAAYPCSKICRRSVSAAHIGEFVGVDDDALARPDERRHENADAVFQ